MKLIYRKTTETTGGGIFVSIYNPFFSSHPTPRNSVQKSWIAFLINISKDKLKTGILTLSKNDIAEKLVRN